MMKLQCTLWTDRSRWCVSTTKAIMASKPKLFNARRFQAADWRSYFRLWHIEIIGGRSPPFQSLCATNPSLEKHSSSRSSGESISFTEDFTILITHQDYSRQNCSEEWIFFAVNGSIQEHILLVANPMHFNSYVPLCLCVCVCVVCMFFCRRL